MGSLPGRSASHEVSERPFGRGPTKPTERGLISYGSDCFLGVYGVPWSNSKKRKGKEETEKKQPCNGQVDVQF